MVRSLVKVALIAAAATLGANSAGAQFNPFSAIFGSPPPRPPGNMPGGAPTSVPGGRQQMGTPSPQQPSLAPYGGVESQPLPPPGAALPGQRPQRNTPVPFDPATLPSDDVVAEPPSQKVTNTAALFSGLDKITGRITNFDVTVGETVQFGALQLTPRACYTRPPTEAANTDAFVEVDEITLQGEVRRVFNGWMFASSPGLNAVEHPIYDVWLTACKGPVVAAIPPAPEPPATPPRRTPPASDPAAPRPQRAPPVTQNQPPPQQQPVQRRPQPPPPQQQPSFTPFGR